MNFAKSLPTALFSRWSGLFSVINRQIAPSLAWSSGLLATQSSSETAKERKEAEEAYDMPYEQIAALKKIQTKYFLAEEITGGNEEAMLCLQKAGPETWGVCANYESYVEALVKQEKSRQSTRGAGAESLRVDTYFAESDFLSGQKGQLYFEKCWSEERLEGIIKFHSYVGEGRDHDSITFPGSPWIIDLLKNARDSLSE